MYATQTQMQYALEAFKATTNALKMMNERLEFIEQVLGIEFEPEDTVDNDGLQDKMLAVVLEFPQENEKE